MADGPDILVYHCPPTRSVRVVFLLEELGLPYKVKRVPNPEEHRGVLRNDPEFSRINPEGRLPTIKDGDIVMEESIAIMEYLLEQYDREHKLAPPTIQRVPRADFLKWLTWSETSLSVPLGGWLRHVALLPEEERDAKAAEMYQNATVDALRALEQGLEESPGGVVGGDFTAVDISLFFAAYVLAENPRVKVLNQENYPRTYEWYQRMKERPAAKKAYE